MGDAKKVEIVTSVSKTSATLVTKTTTKKNGETTTVITEKSKDEVPAEKATEEKAAEKTEGEKTADEVLESVEKEVKMEASKACTLKRGVNFDTPTKGVSSHLGDTSVTCIRLTNAQLTNGNHPSSFSYFHVCISITCFNFITCIY